MNVTKTVLTAGLVAAALLAALSRSTAAVSPPEVPPRATPLETRASEWDLRLRAAEETYARVGNALVGHLVERGLAH